MHKRKLGGMLMLMAFLLSACSGLGLSNNLNTISFSKTADEAKAGGTVTYGYTSPFQGLFEPAFLKEMMIPMFLISLRRLCLPSRMT